jgi:N-methylhydantoinase B/acetone carboxylase, alpha subunit
MMAQMSANYRGEEEIIELAKRYGSDKLLEYFEEILNYSERSMRRAIQDIPDGEASFEDYIEYDGIGTCLIKIKTRIKIEGSDIYIDFKGTGRPGGRCKFALGIDKIFSLLCN